MIEQSHIKILSPGVFNGWTDGAKVVVLINNKIHETELNRTTHGRYDYVFSDKDVATALHTIDAAMEMVCTLYVACTEQEFEEIVRLHPNEEIFYLCKLGD